MIDEHLIKDIILQSRERFPISLVTRKSLERYVRYLNFKEVLAITGARRSGKTYFMYSLINNLLSKGVSHENLLYLNFEDERMALLVPEDFERTYETFLKVGNPKGRIYFFLDEIQNAPLWEKWTARMYEKNIKFVVSGSGSALLSSEFSTALTGRNIPVVVHPFSFREFVAVKEPKLAEKNVENVQHVTEQRALVTRLFLEYLENGGFPEVILENKPELLGNYFKDIVARDIILRKKVRFTDSVAALARFLITNASARNSFYSLKRIINARGINTVKNYVWYLEEAYLIFRVPMFSYSLKQQIYNPFKVYCIDTGLRNAVSFRAGRDTGKLAENAVFLELKRMGKEIYYWKNGKDREVDFVIREGLRVNELIQVCWDVSDDDTKRREIASLLTAAKLFKLKKCMILTGEYEGMEKIERVHLYYMPIWKWLLEA